ncbi:hypothetical protein TNCV_2768251, partial [Trichonephila clavipes]
MNFLKRKPLNKYSGHYPDLDLIEKLRYNPGEAVQQKHLPPKDINVIKTALLKRESLALQSCTRAVGKEPCNFEPWLSMCAWVYDYSAFRYIQLLSFETCTRRLYPRDTVHVEDSRLKTEDEIFSSIVRDFLELFYNLLRTVLAKNKIVLDPALRLQSFRTPKTQQLVSEVGLNANNKSDGGP